MEFHELITKELKSFGNEIKTTVKQWTRLPVSAVLLPPKLLQKISNVTAKSNPQYNGILNLVDNPQLDDLLKNTELTDIWGIGSGLSQRLY